MIKICAISLLAAIGLQVAVASSRLEGGGEHQEPDNEQVAPSSISLSPLVMDKLANLTQKDNLWLLIPSDLVVAAAANESQTSESHFSLFKLNTGGQLSADQIGADGWTSAGTQIGVGGGGGEGGGGEGGNQPPSANSTNRLPRSARKLNLFKNVLGKPQVSPLYLVNGTVCRFVNSQPICTTLSTTGLFRGQNQGPGGPGSFGLFQGNNNNQQQQQQQQGQLFNQNQQQQQQPNQRQVSPQQNNNQYSQQYRPMAVLDNEQKPIDVASNLSSRAQQVIMRPAGGQNSMRPGNNYAIRRPLNLISLGRPFRSG